MKAISLFSGVGGFEQGFDRAGIETVLQVEYDKHAISVLERHWPDTRRSLDVRDIARAAYEMEDCPDGCDEVYCARHATHFWECDCVGIHEDELIDSEVIYGGFPCQDISAGRDRWATDGQDGATGLDGFRSGLWWEFHRIVQELQTPWVVIENVERLWTGRESEDLRAILTALDELDYMGTAAVLDAGAFGLPATRPRVFIVARYAGDSRGLAEGQRMAECFASDDPGRFVWQRTGQSLPTDFGLARPTPGSYRKLTPIECERLMGWPDDWTRYAADGSEISDTQRYRMCGNGVASPVAEWVGRQIVAVDQLDHPVA